MITYPSSLPYTILSSMSTHPYMIIYISPYMSTSTLNNIQSTLNNIVICYIIMILSLLSTYPTSISLSPILSNTSILSTTWPSLSLPTCISPSNHPPSINIPIPTLPLSSTILSISSSTISSSTHYYYYYYHHTLSTTPFPTLSTTSSNICLILWLDSFCLHPSISIYPHRHHLSIGIFHYTLSLSLSSSNTS